MLNIIKINVNIVENIIYMHVVAISAEKLHAGLCYIYILIACKQNVPNQ